MTKAFSSGKNAVGFCDRCGFRYKLSTLRMEYRDSAPVNNLVCRDCFDKDHPQYKAGRKTYSDPQGLRNPRPDLALKESRSLGGFNPLRGNQLTVSIGTVSVA